MNLKDILSESNLARVYKHMTEHDTGVVTAFRYAPDCGKGTPYTREDNLKRNKSLLANIFSKGYNVIALRGAYIENFGTKDAIEVQENTFFVIDVKDRGKLLDDLKELGEKYEQDSILFVPRGGERSELHGTNHCPNSFPGYGQVNTFNERQLGSTGQFFSRVSGRPFTFLQETIMSEEVAPEGWFGRWGCAEVAKKDWKTLNL